MPIFVKMRAIFIRRKCFVYIILALLCICLWILGNSLYSSKFNLSPRVELEDLDGMEQDDPFLIRYLQQHHIYPPSTREYRYSELDQSRQFFINDSRHVTKIIQSYLKNMTNGVFVEAGASNGANELSNTLVLERDYNWTGLLVEGSPVIFPRLVAAHRKSWKSDLLLSQHPQTKLVVFEQSPSASMYAGRESVYGPILPPYAPVAVVADDGDTPLFYFEVLSVPLYSLVAACNFKTIDYLSLDVEGTELEILKNFPFDKVLIRTMIVEFNLLGKKRARELVGFLKTKGYFRHRGRPTKRDLIFIHQSVIESLT